MIPWELAGTALAASLAGSVHCAGMCGPIVGLAALHPGPGTGVRRAAVRGSAGHALGRMLAYVLYGAVAGAAGSTVEGLAVAQGLSGSVATLSGIGLVVAGLLGLAGRAGGATGAAPRREGRIAAIRKAIARRASAAALRRPLRAGIVLGGLSALLPCGFLWAFVAVAAGTADPVAGALVMAAFWAGTVPVLGLVGIGGGLVGLRLRARLAAAVPVILVAVGAFVLVYRAPASAGAAGGTDGPPPCHAHGG